MYGLNFTDVYEIHYSDYGSRFIQLIMETTCLIDVRTLLTLTELFAITNYGISSNTHKKELILIM